MKILQLTFTYGNNMGAMLQAYALNKTLTEMGNDCYFLPFYEKPFEIVKTKISAKEKVLSVFRRIKGRQYTDKWFKQFNSFLYDKCQFAPYVDLNELDSIEKNYDKFIVGSDQVWNMMAFNSEYCLLKWVSDRNKKCSYAASLGAYSIRMQNDTVLDTIKDFNSLSFRETIDYEDAKRNGVECRLDLDPTLLIDKSVWYELTDSKYEYLNDYICIFGFDKQSYAFAKEYAKKKGLKVIVVNYFGNRILPGIKIINPPSPTELLSVIEHANCIVTHSYHVFILSLNLNTQVFITTKNTGRSANRFDTIINMFGLENREAKIENIDCVVEWDKFNRQLLERRDDSLSYLKRMTENDS